MRIINCHTHLIDINEVLAEDKRHYLEYIRNIPTFSDVEKVSEMVSVNSLILQMDEAEIEKSVLFAVDAPLLTASNEFVHNICQKYPERFVGFASVNPNKPDALQKLGSAIQDLGMKGLKFHPPLQDFFPNDPKLRPFYTLAIELGIPVVFHVGSTPFGNLVKLKQADPLLIDEVANEFPDLRILLTHLGTLWHNESFMITEKHPNVYIDTAAYPYEIETLLTEKTIMRVGPRKFLFGTDFPMPYEGGLHRMIDFTTCIRQLKISEELKEMIFYRNFEQLMMA
jgi:hypothetical protein